MLERDWAAFLADAEVHVPQQSVFPHQSCFEAAGLQHGLPTTLLLAIARGESDFDRHAVSPADAVGLMQIRWPVTARHLGVDSRRRLYDPCTNIDAAARYLNELLDTFGGNLHLALLAYNRGPSALAGELQRRASVRDIWYSSYIFDHLDFVLERAVGAGTAVAYAETGRIAIVTFRAPFHARGLADHLNEALAPLHFDWFKLDQGGYEVTFHFDDPNQRRLGLNALRRRGLLSD